MQFTRCHIEKWLGFSHNFRKASMMKCISENDKRLRHLNVGGKSEQTLLVVHTIVSTPGSAMDVRQQVG